MHFTIAGFLVVTVILSVSAQTLTDAEAAIQAENFPRAQNILEHIVEMNPGNVEAAYRLGYVYYRQRALGSARQQFANVLKMAPPAFYSRYFLGRIALLENKPKEAITWLEPVATAVEPVMDAVSQLAKAYETTGQHSRSIPLLQAAITQAPWDSALYYRLGRDHQKLGQPELAREALATSERLKTADAESVRLLQECADHVAKNERAEALRARDTLLSRANLNPDTLVAAGVLLGRAGWQPDALPAFEAAAKRDPALFQAQYNYGLALLKTGRPSEANAPLSRAVVLLPQSAEANAGLGLSRVLSGAFPDAIEPLARALQLEPHNIKVATLLALAHVRTGAPAKAVPLLRGIIRGGAADPQPYLVLVEALNANEDPAGALEVAQDARRRFPKSPQAQMAAAQQLARVGRYQDAAPVFAAVAELAPHQPEALLGWADGLQKSGDHAQAVDVYSRALKVSPHLLPASLGLARSLMALRRFEDARRTLEAALSAHANDRQLHVELSRVYARLGKPELAAEQTRILEQLATREER